MIFRYFQTVLLTSGSEQQSSVKVQLDKIQKEGAQMSTETATQFACLREELNEAVKALLETKDKARPNEDEVISPSTDICSTLSRLQSMSRSLSQENQILRRLYFDNIYAREDTIADAESGTFKWILEEDEDKSIHSISVKDDESVHSTEEDYERLSLSSEQFSNAEEKLTRRESRADEDDFQDREKESTADLESEILVQVEQEPNHGEQHDIETRANENTRKSPRGGQDAYPELEMRAQTRNSFLT
jgi:hypothetical protein